MKAQRRLVLAGAAALAASGLFARPAQAQPRDGVVRVLVGTPPGAQLDIVARILADRLREASGQAHIVDNRPGATGRIAMQALRAAEPDGNTIMMVPSGWLTTVPHTVRKLPFDTLTDFVPLAKVCSFGFAFAVGPATPAQTLGEFVAWCKANPKQASFAVPIAGGTLELLGWFFGKSAGVELTSIPYKGGGGEFRRDIIAGRVPAGIGLVSEFVPDHRSGRVKALAVTTSRRASVLPEVPTFAEQGFPEMTANEWFGFIAPGGTPNATAARLAGALRDAVQAGAVLETFAKLGLEPNVTVGQELAGEIRAQYVEWGRIVKAVGFTPAD